MLGKRRNIRAVTLSQSCIPVYVFYDNTSLAEWPKQSILLILLHSVGSVSILKCFFLS